MREATGEFLLSALILPVLNMAQACTDWCPENFFRYLLYSSLLAIPFFILAGNLMNKGGGCDPPDQFFAKNCLPVIFQVPLLIPTQWQICFGAISGSGTVAASAMGSIIGPIEEEEGYDRDFSTGRKYCHSPYWSSDPAKQRYGITIFTGQRWNLSSSPFMAGYIPGILWGLACMVVDPTFCKEKGYRSTKKYTASEKSKKYFYRRSRVCLMDHRSNWRNYLRCIYSNRRKRSCSCIQHGIGNFLLQIH